MEKFVRQWVNSEWFGTHSAACDTTIAVTILFSNSASILALLHKKYDSKNNIASLGRFPYRFTEMKQMFKFLNS